TDIHARLAQQHRAAPSYSAVWRLLRGLEARNGSGAATRSRESRRARRFASRGTAPSGGPARVNGRLLDGNPLTERHAHLVGSATRLLLKYGFHQTSVRDIAAAAGWQVGTLYLYISRKEDILQLIMDEIKEAFLEELRRVVRQPTARATLCVAFERYVQAAGRMNRELRLLYRESASLRVDQRESGLQRELAEREFFAEII